MKLTILEDGRAAKKSRFLFALGIALAVSIARLTSTQQSLTAQGWKASGTAKKEFTEEWVHRVHYGHEDEWFLIFKKYQVAILERQKQLGFVKQYTVRQGCTPARRHVGTIESSSFAVRTMRLQRRRKMRLRRNSFQTKPLLSRKKAADEN